MASDIRDEIRNAISILGAPGAGAEHVVGRNLSLAVSTLRSAIEAIDRIEGEMEMITSPELDAVKEARSLRDKLEASEGRAIELEQKFEMLKHEKDVEKHIQAEERKRLSELEKRSKTLDKVLMEDQDAFAKYMDQAMDEHDRKNGKKGYEGR